MPFSWNRSCDMRGGSALGRCRWAPKIAVDPPTSGSTGKAASAPLAKSKHEVMSPQTERCHGLIAGMVMPKRCSRNWPTEVWSKTSLLTQPPVLHGETTYIGTRGPRPNGRVVPERSEEHTSELQSLMR